MLWVHKDTLLGSSYEYIQFLWKNKKNTNTSVKKKKKKSKKKKHLTILIRAVDPNIGYSFVNCLDQV